MVKQEVVAPSARLPQKKRPIDSSLLGTYVAPPDPGPERPPTYRQGDRIFVKAKNDHAPMHGLVQFVGEISSLGKGLWIGVQL